MTHKQLTRLNKTTLVARIEDLEETIDTLQLTLAQPVEVPQAAIALGLALRDRLAGIALLTIELGELAYSLGQWTRRAARF